MDEPEIIDPFSNPDKPVAVTFDEITSAAYRIKSGIRNTECSYSAHLSNLTGMEIYVKKEFLQATGSFKERGARYAMMMLSPEEKSNGIVAASAGNHAQACCYHGATLGIPVTVFMPVTAPIMKIQKCRDYKGDVKVQGANLSEAKKLAMAYARDNGMIYLNGYDHPKILAGQGTIGLEVWEQVPNLEAVIVPVGGGGLIAGISIAVKALDKNIKIIGVEPERAASLTAALKAGQPVEIKVGSTLADGLAVAKFGYNSFESIKKTLDKCITVHEHYIALAVLKLVECEKSVVEGAGASPLAAILQGLLPEYQGKTVCLILSGGNIDTSVLGRVLDRGMAADGRLVKVKIHITDRVGGIEELTGMIGDIGVHIKDISHERAWVVEDVFSVEVKVVCECSGREQSLQLREILAEKYGHIVFNGFDYPDHGPKKSQIFALPIDHRASQILSEVDKPSIQQQIIDFESQPPAISSKEITVTAFSQFSSKRPSQEGTQTEQTLEPTSRTPRSIKQDGTSESTSKDSAEQCGDTEEATQVPKIDSTEKSQKDEVFSKKSAKGSQTIVQETTKGEVATVETATELTEEARKTSIQGDGIITSEKIVQKKSVEYSSRPGSAIQSTGKAGGGESNIPSKKSSAQTDQVSTSASGGQRKSVEVSKRAGSVHSDAKSAGSQTITESIKAPRKTSLNADPTAAAKSAQSTETTPTEPREVRESGTVTPRPLSACNCKRRGAPGDYESKK